MRRREVLVLLLSAIVYTNCLPKHKAAHNEDKEQELNNYLKGVYEKEASEVLYKQVVAEWNLATDVSNKTKEALQESQTLETAKYIKETWEKHFKGLKPDQFNDPILQREVFFLSILGTSALDEKKLGKLTSTETKMSNIYSTAKICPYKNQNCDLSKEGLSLDPEIEEILSSSTDYDELEYVWSAWRNASGKKMRQDYKVYVDLSNEAARLNGYKDMGEMWRTHYESETFIQDMDELWNEVKPLYNELHTYVLDKLRQRYPELERVEDDLIPAHLLGNMWAQSWIYLNDYVKPYPNASEFDVTKALKEQGYTPLKMFEVADEFYQSLGLEPNGICYNVSAGAVIEKPEDRDIVCHASAWDFYNGRDYRVKMCTKVNQEDFITIHHEMGHIQYYLLYKDQPLSLRSGANPGFHEAVGDTIALSVSTPDHLHAIGLLPDYEPTMESSINALMQMALERVAFLPFGLLIDKWRWDVFSNNVDQNGWNERWWHYRQTIQKVKPPNKRTEDDFDPGAKYHVPGNSQYIAYFVAHLLEFQLHRALCIEAGLYDPSNPESAPLHKCDIYKSKAAGAKLRAGLSLGASKHWSLALEAMTGEKKLSGAALLEYFKPLYEYLKEANSKIVPNRLMAQDNENKGSEVQATPTDRTVPIAIAGVVGLLAIAGVVGFVIMKKMKNQNV